MTVFTERFTPTKGAAEKDHFWAVVCFTVVGLSCFALAGYASYLHRTVTNPPLHTYYYVVSCMYGGATLGLGCLAYGYYRLVLLITWRDHRLDHFIAWVRATAFPLEQCVFQAALVTSRPGGLDIQTFPPLPGAPTMVQFPQATLIRTRGRHSYRVDPGNRLVMYDELPCRQAHTLVQHAVDASDPGLHIERVLAGTAPAAR